MTLFGVLVDQLHAGGMHLGSQPMRSLRSRPGALFLPKVPATM